MKWACADAASGVYHRGFREYSTALVGVPMAAALSVTHGFLPPHPARLRLPPFSMPIWVKPCCTDYSGNPDRDSRRSGLRSRVEGIDKPIPEGLYSAKTFSEEECRALASASGPLWCR